MGPRERELREQIAQILSEDSFVRGTLSIRERKCGKPNCRCVRGDKHVSLYLVARDRGEYQQLFIPRDLEIEARRWVEIYQRIRDLLEELSRLHWDKLRRREP